MPLESAIKKKILENLRKYYPQGVWFKIHGSPYQERGIPDVIGSLDGKFIAFEIKRPDEYRPPTAYQQMQIDRINQSGGLASVVTSWVEVKNILEKTIYKDN